MNTKYETSTELADAKIQSLAIQAIKGQRPESDARWHIAAAILSTGITAQVASFTPDLNEQLREDLATELTVLIERKALQETDGGYDLHRAASGESACGWARALAKAAVLSTLRNIRLHTNRNLAVDPVLDLSSNTPSVTYAEAALHLNGVEDEYDLENHLARVEELQAIQDDFTEAASGRRSSGRLRIIADALISTYEIPAASRPDDFLDREWIREAIGSRFQMAEDGSGEVETNIETARNAVISLLAFIMDREDDGQREIDQRLRDLWSDYSAEELQVLAIKPARVAQTLALAAVSSAPRPSRGTMSLTLRTIRLADDDVDHAAFKAFTKRLLDSWVATEAEAVNEFDNRGQRTPESAMLASAQRLASALDWPAVAAEAVARPGQPFGSSESEVKAFISSIVTAVSR